MGGTPRDVGKKGDKHSEGVKRSKFCALRRTKCYCPNRYKKILKDMEGTNKEFKFPQLKEYKKGIISKWKTVWLNQEAHHIVCVASVTELLGKNESIRKVIRQAEYCINKENNMIALPRFEHTVCWYMFYKSNPPPFKNLPNHNYDHGMYINELKVDLKQLVKDIKTAGHGCKPESVVKKLHGLSDTYRTKLNDRGIRQSGTHKAWEDGTEDKNARWFEPYSMAKDEDVTIKVMPRFFGEEVHERFEKLLEALL